jgi:hypothetical protein
MRATEDADRYDWADDGKCVDREPGVDPLDDLPEMELVVSNCFEV